MQKLNYRIDATENKVSGLNTRINLDTVIIRNQLVILDALKEILTQV